MERHKTLLLKLKSGKVANNYLFLSDNAYEKNKAIKLIAETFIPDAKKREVSMETLYSGELDGFALEEKLTNLGFFSSEKIIVLKEAEKMEDDVKEFLTGYLKNPLKTTCLIIDSAEAKPQTIFYKNLEKMTECYTFILYDNEIYYWIKDYVRGLGKTIEEEAVRFLQERIGSNLYMLSSELDKLNLYILEGKTITEKDAMLLTGEFISGSIFNLVDAIGKKNASLSLKYLARIISDGESPIRIFNMILRQFKLIWSIKALMKKGIDPYGISKSLGLHERVVENLLTQQKYFNFGEIPLVFSRLLKLDLEMKSSPNQHRAMESFILELTASC